MRRLMILPPAAVALAMLLTPAFAQERDTTQDDELKLKNAFQKTDGASLAGFLRTRARGEASHQALTELIEALGSKSGSARNQACAELVAIGAPAIPMLRRASRDSDSPDAAALARRCLKILEEEQTQLTTAAVRLLV